MQFSSWKSTMPLAYCTIAPGDGQAFRQPGSSQCMQPSLRISHSRLPFVFSYSVNRITRPRARRQIARIVVDADVGADLVAQVVPFHAGDLAGLAADALGDVDELGDRASAGARGARRSGRVVAERRMISSDCSAMLSSYTFSTLTRNDLNSGVCELASPTDGVSVLARKPGFATPLKPQWIGMPTWCSVLPSICQRLDPLGHDRDGDDMAALGADLDAIAGGDAEFLRQAPRRFPRTAPAARSRSAARAWSSSGNARSAGRWCRMRELVRLAERLRSSVEHARRRIVRARGLFGMQRVVASGVSNGS